MQNSSRSTRQILVIGGGSIGERHVRCFQRTGRAEVTLCEVRQDVRERVAAEYGLTQSFSSLEDGFEQEFDAAVICTPAHLHVSMAQHFVEQDTAVLIEKPLSTVPDGVDALQALAAAKHVPVAVAYVLRQHPALLSIRDALKSGRFGRPLQIVHVGGQHFPYYRPAYRETYYTRHETGGGAIQDALTHVMNAAEWLVGPVTRLVADAEHCLLEGTDVEDTAHLLTRHGSVVGSFALNQHQAPNETTLTIVCDRGTLRFEAHNSRWLSCREPGSDWAVEAEYRIERDDLFVQQANAFLDFVDGTRPASCTIAEAAQTLRVNLAALKSADSGSWVTP